MRSLDSSCCAACAIRHWFNQRLLNHEHFVSAKSLERSTSLLPHPLQGATLCLIAPIHLPIRKRSNQNSESQRTTTFSLICDFLSFSRTDSREGLPAAATARCCGYLRLSLTVPGRLEPSNSAYL